MNIFRTGKYESRAREHGCLAFFCADWVICPNETTAGDRRIPKKSINLCKMPIKVSYDLLYICNFDKIVTEHGGCS